MPEPRNIGWLRQVLAAQGVTLRADLPDHQVITQHPLGADETRPPVASTIGRIDLARVLLPTANPQLVTRRLALGLHVVADQPEGEGAEPPAGGGARASAVDWRNRFGGNWITSIRDQNPCSSCWAFAGTALVEAMLKIEHAYWTRLSEGDLHDGVGSRCADGNNLGNVSTFLSNHGLADPGCWPYHTDDAAYAPTSDRNGRSVRVPAFTWIGDVEQQKQWIDSTGPIATWFDVYQDFDGYSGGYVYRRSTDPDNHERGGHFLLVVGYDDGQQAWICKNSWGAWGDHGYVLVGYGEAGIDQYAKAGLTGLNPDPWTKRRLHNGNLYESGNGAAHRNFEAVSVHSGAVTSYWREGTSPFPWASDKTFAADATHAPTLTGTTYDRNLELVYRTTGNRLHHWWRAGGGGDWNDGGVFGPTDTAGVPGFVQGDYGAPGNFEVVVRTADGRLAHWWRIDGAPWTWQESARFGANIAYSGPSLVQGDYLDGGHGNLELVAVTTAGALQHFWRSEHDGVWHDGPTFGAGVASPPVMIQGQYGMHDEAGPHGNFELCVAVGGAVQHWWRDNASGSMVWRSSATFGHDVAQVVGLVEGSFGMNLEILVRRTNGQLQHWWRDGAGWHEGPTFGPTDPRRPVVRKPTDVLTKLDTHLIRPR
jgi:hypothetical protein